MKAFGNSGGISEELMTKRACHACHNRLSLDPHHLIRHGLQRQSSSNVTKSGNSSEALFSTSTPPTEKPTYSPHAVHVSPSTSQHQIYVHSPFSLSALNPFTTIHNYNPKIVSPPTPAHTNTSTKNHCMCVLFQFLHTYTHTDRDVNIIHTSQTKRKKNEKNRPVNL